jgi:hypothetical protein
MFWNEQGNESGYNKVFTAEGARSKDKVNQVFNKIKSINLDSTQKLSKANHQVH